MYKLEDRILFDGAAIADVVDAQQEAEAQQEAAQAAEAEEAAQHNTDHDADDSSDGDSGSTDAHDNDTLAEVLSEIHAGNLGSDGQRIDVLLVSSSLENADDIVNSASTDTIVVVYDARTASAADLLQQITTALDGKVADSIGFVTESGENAHIQLFADTDTSLDTVNDSVHQNFFSNLDSLLDEGGQVNLFASNLASTAEGEALVDAMSDAIGHDVAASTDETGSESAGGDWELEYSTNENLINAAETYLDENSVANFDSLLEDHISNEVAFINSSVKKSDPIIAVLEARGVDIVLIDNAEGLSQISDYLAEHSGVDGIHIITHGNKGYFLVGSDTIDNDSLNSHADTIASWGDHLNADADIMIYGCNLTASGEGMNLVEHIADLTGADVAASNDATGSRGDWELEYTTGDIETAGLAVYDYQYTLTNRQVNSMIDAPTDSLGDGVMTLRKAIEDSLDGDSITFAALSTLGTDTVILVSSADPSGYGQLEITQDISIDGTIAITGGYLRATVTNGDVTDPTNQFRLLYIADTAGTDAAVDIYNMVFTSGEADVRADLDYTGEGNGGGIYIAGSAVLRDVDVTNSHADVNGGGIYVASTGSLEIENDQAGSRYGVSISSNDADTSGGGIFNNSGTITITGYATHEVNINNNTAGGSGGGLYSIGDVTTTYGYFFFNRSLGDGGAIYITGGTALSSLSNTTIWSNTSSGDGGGIYFFQSQDLNVFDSNINFNTAAGDGGGLYINESRHVNDVASQINNNTADNGGGIYLTESGNFYHERGYINNNTARYSGGAVYMTHSGYGAVDGYESDLYLFAMDISNNTTNSLGAGGNGTIYYDGVRKTGVEGAGSTIIYMSAIDNNDTVAWDGSTTNTADNGGAIYQLAGDLSIWSSTLAFNSVNDHGGSIYFIGNNLDVEFATLAYNSAPWGGSDIFAAINTASDTITVKNSIIYDNTGLQQQLMFFFGPTVLDPATVVTFNNNIYTNYTLDAASDANIATIVQAGSGNIVNNDPTWMGPGAPGGVGNISVTRQAIIDNLYLDTEMRNYYNYNARVLPLLVDYNQSITEGDFGWQNIAWKAGTTDYNSSIEYDTRGNTRIGYEYDTDNHEYVQNDAPSIGAFEPIYTIVVTSKADDGSSGYFDSALTNGITLREAVRWMDSYDAITYATSTDAQYQNGALYNKERYIKFDENVFSSTTDNVITLSSQINITKSVIIGMTPWLNDQLKVNDGGNNDNDISLLNMTKWGGFRAQDSTGRIIVSGNNANSIFRINESDSISGNTRVYINNLTLTEGYSHSGDSGNSGRGGAIQNSTNLYLSNVAVTNSTANNISSSFDDATGWGGGIYNTGNLTLVETTVSGNTAFGNSSSTDGATNAGLGGGIYSTGNLTILSSSIHDNTARGTQYVSNNSANGGGIYYDGNSSDLLIANTTIGNNTTNADYGSAGNLHGQGSAIYLETGNFYMYYNTVVQNTAIRKTEEAVTGSTAAIVSAINYDDTSSSNLQFYNNIIANNDYSFTGSTPKTRDLFDLYLVVNDPAVTPANVDIAFNIIGQTTGLTINTGAGAANNQYNIIGDAVYGKVSNLNLEETLAYNGGKTQSYKILDNSVAYQNGIDLVGASFVDIDQRGADRTYAGASTTIGSYQPLQYIVVTSTSDTNSASDVGFDFGSNSTGWMKTDLQLREAFALADIFTKVIIANDIKDGDDQLTDPSVVLSQAAGFGELVADIGFILDGRSYNYTRSYSAAASATTYYTGISLYTDTPKPNLVIDGSDTSRIVRVSDGTDSNINYTISYTTLQNGYSATQGGALYSLEDLTLDHVSVLNSESGLQGGGIYSQVGSLIINDSTIQGNKAGTHGGGLYYESNSLDITRSSFLENESTQSGGGIYAIGAQIAMNSSTVGDNKAGIHGGGIFSDSSNLFTINSTIANNTADENGGGIVFNGGGYLRMGYVTIANNISGADASAVQKNGGGLYQTAGSLNIYNSIIAQNYERSISSENLNDIYLGTAVSFATDEIQNNVLGATINNSGNTISSVNNHRYNSLTGRYERYNSGTGLYEELVLNIDTVLADNGGSTKTIYIGDLDEATEDYGADLYYTHNTATNVYTLSLTGTPVDLITTDQRGESRATGSITVGAYQKNTTHYYFLGGDYNVYTNWSKDGSTPLTEAEEAEFAFSNTDARYHISAELSTIGDWTINWRSILIIDGASMTVSEGDTLDARIDVQNTLTIADTGDINVRGYSLIDDAGTGIMVVNGAISTVDTSLNGESELRLENDAVLTLATVSYSADTFNLINKSTTSTSTTSNSTVSYTYNTPGSSQLILDVKDTSGNSTAYDNLILGGAGTKTYNKSSLTAETLTFSDSDITLDIIAGSLTINAGGSDSIGASIELTGDLTINGGTQTDYANTALLFKGISAQTIISNTARSFNSITVNNAAGVELTGSNSVDVNTFEFTNGSFMLNDGDLTINNNSGVTGASGADGRYFITAGNGHLIQNVLTTGTHYLLAVEKGTSGLYKWTDLLLTSDTGSSYEGSVRLIDSVSSIDPNFLKGSLTVTWKINTNDNDFTFKAENWSKTDTTTQASAQGIYFNEDIATLHFSSSSSGPWAPASKPPDEDGFYYFGHDVTLVTNNKDGIDESTGHYYEGSLRDAVSNISDSGVVVFDNDSNFNISSGDPKIDAHVKLTDGAILIGDGITISIIGLTDGRNTVVENTVSGESVFSFNATATADLSLMELQASGTYAIVNGGDLTMTDMTIRTGSSETINNTGSINVYETLALDNTALGNAFTYHDGSTLAYVGDSTIAISDTSAEFSSTIRNLSIRETATLSIGNLTSDRTIDGTLDVASGAALALNDTLTVNDNVSVLGSMSISATSNLKLKGADNELGSFTAADGSTVTYAGTGTQIADTVTYSNVTVESGAIVNFRNTGTATINGELDSSGTIGFDGAGGNLVLNGDATFGAFNYGTSTVSYLGGDQTIDSGVGYYNLVLGGGTSGTGVTKDITGDLTINNDFSINDYTTMEVGTQTVTVTGTYTVASLGNFTFTDNGYLYLGGTVSAVMAFTNGYGTVVYNGSSSQTVISGTYNNLQINNGDKILAGDVAVLGNFLFDTTGSGRLLVDAYDITINGLIQNASGSDERYFVADYAADNGTVKLQLTAGIDKTMVIGTLSNWSELTFTGDLTTQTIAINVFDGVTIDGEPDGIEIAYPEYAVNMTFKITPEDTFNMSIVDSSASGADFDPLIQAVRYYGSDGWEEQNSPFNNAGSYFFGIGIPDGGLVVTTDAATGQGSLAWAIAAANFLEGTNYITFSKDFFFQARDITLNGELTITDTVVIEGLGTDLITVHGNDSRVFNINNSLDSKISVSISGITITDGNSIEGAAIYNSEILRLENVEVINSIGYGVYNIGTLYTMNTTIAENTDTGIYNLGDMTLYNTTVADNELAQISTFGGTSKFFNVTIAGTGGLNIDSAAELEIKNTIIAGGIGGSGTYTGSNNYLGYDMFEDGTSYSLTDNGGWVRTIAIINDSTVVDAGLGYNDGAYNYDARGYLNSGDGKDIGAYEYNGYVAQNVDTGEYYSSVSDAVNAAGGGEEIRLVDTRVTVDSTLNINEDLYITGTGDAWSTVLAHTGTGNILTIGNASNAPAVTLANLGLRGGNNAGGNGGAIVNYGSLHLYKTVISDSSAAYGGGIYNMAGAYLGIERSMIAGNIATIDGGGIYNLGTTYILNSTIQYNTADNGGAIYNGATSVPANLRIEGSTINNNTATTDGGGIYSEGTFHGENSTIYANTATNNGGGIYFDSGTSTFLNMTIAYNTANMGGGVYIAPNANLTSYNTIIAYNTTSDTTATLPWNDLYASSSDNYSIEDSSNLVGYYYIGTIGDEYNFDYTSDLFSGLLTDNGGWTKTLSLRANQTYITLNDWTLDGNEYWASSNPGYSNKPSSIWYVDSLGVTHYLTEGIAGALTEGQWAWDNSSKQVIVRLADDTDPSTVSVIYNSNNLAINSGNTDISVATDQRGYLTNGTRDIGAYEYDGYIGYYLYQTSSRTTKFYVSSIQDAMDIFTADNKHASNTLYLINSRIKESDITSELTYTVKEGDKYVSKAKTVNIVGSSEGETVISAGGAGRVFYLTSHAVEGGNLVVNNVQLADGINMIKPSPLADPDASNSYGGAIYMKGADITLNNSSIVNSLAGRDGGAIYAIGDKYTNGEGKEVDIKSSITLNNSYLGSNRSGRLGGALAGDTTMKITSSTIYDNISGGSGGAIAVTGTSTLTLENSTVAWNLAMTPSGGGIFVSGGDDKGALTASNSLIARNYQGLSPDRDAIIVVSFSTGEDVPTSAEGNNGDTYVVTNEALEENGNVYIKTAGEWVLTSNITESDAAVIVTGSGAPDDNTEGNDGDYYVDTTNGTYYVKDQNSWVYLTEGNIEDGNNIGPTLFTPITTGTEAPTDSTSGSYYLDTTTGKFYISSHASVDKWVESPSYDIPVGGDTILSGDTPPEDTEGNNGDFYLNTNDGKVYLKSNGSWRHNIDKIGGDSAQNTTGMDYYHVNGKLTDNGYNLVEYQNGSAPNSESADQNYFGAKYTKTDSAKTKVDKHDIVGSREHIFATDNATDNGGWTWTLELASNSAALNKGTGSVADQRGYGAHSTADIGAYELYGTVATNGSNSYSTIQEAINDASSGDTITLNGTRILEHDIQVDKSLTLTGTSGSGLSHGSVVDGGRVGRVMMFKGSSNTVNLSNMIVTGGYAMDSSLETTPNAAGNGGAIFSNSTLTLTDVQIRNSFAQISGGGVYSANGLNIYTGSHNAMDFSTGIYGNTAGVAGGGIFTQGTLNVKGVRYNGTIYDRAYFMVQFHNNTAWSGGGAISIQGSANMQYFHIQNNDAMNGGAISMTGSGSNSVLADYLIEDNYALNNGGALYVNNYGDLTLKSNGNRDYVFNGSYYAVTIANSFAAGDGGAVYMNNSGTLNITSISTDEGVSTQELIKINSNTAYGSGAGIYFANSQNIDFGYYVNVYFNTAYGNGGGIYFADSNNIYFSFDCNVYSNWTFGGNGGGIYMLNSNMLSTKNGSSISSNYALYPGVGGGLYAENVNVIDLYYTSLNSNYSYNHGAGMYLKDVDSVILNDVDIYESQGSEGIYALGDSDITIKTSGVSASTGTGIWVEKGTLTLENVTVADNNPLNDYGYSSSNVGGIYLGSGTLSMNFCTVVNNSGMNYFGTEGVGSISIGTGDASTTSYISIVNSIVQGHYDIIDSAIYLSFINDVEFGTNTEVSTSRHNILTFYGYYTNASGLADAKDSNIYNLNGEIAGARDSRSNIVGYDNATAIAIIENLNLDDSLKLHANYRSHAYSLMNSESIAYGYYTKADGTGFTRTGQADSNVVYDQRGNLRSGVEVSLNDDGETVYTFYEKIDSTWYKVSVTEGENPVYTKADNPPAPSVGAFEPLFYATVTSKTDESDSGRMVNVISTDPDANNVHVSTAIINGLTLREAVYWIDSYNPNDADTAGNKIDYDRYVKFSETVFTSDGNNTISLQYDDIFIMKDILISITPGYGGFDGYTADGSYMAQNDSARITVDGGNDSRIFYVESDWDVVISNLTITNGHVTGRSSGGNVGYGDGTGGAIFNMGNLTLNNVVVKNSSATNSNVSGGDDLALGGGIYNDSDATLTLNDTTITGNSVTGNRNSDGDNNVGLGGGIYNNGGTVIINSSLIHNNTANGFAFDKNKSLGISAGLGGGIYSDGGTLTIQNSTIAENSLGASTSRAGSAIYLTNSGSYYLYNNTIVNNAVPTDETSSESSAASIKSRGSAVYLGSGAVTMINNIIANNSQSGSVFIGRDLYVESSVTLTESNNIIGAYRGSFTPDSSDKTGNGTGVVYNLNLANDLAYLGGKTMSYRVLANSVAIGSGTTINGITGDQRGNVRPDSGWTIGSYELLRDITIDVNTDPSAITNNDVGFDFSKNQSGWQTSLRTAAFLDDAGTVTIDHSGWDEATISLIYGGIQVTGFDVTIEAAGTAVTIDGSNSGRIFNINSASPIVTSATLSNLILQNGYAGSQKNDLYIDAATGMVYIRCGSVWTSVNNVIDGSSGTLTRGAGAPNADTEGNYYLDVATGDVYAKNATTKAWDTYKTAEKIQAEYKPVIYVIGDEYTTKNGDYVINELTGELYQMINGEQSLVKDLTDGFDETLFTGTDAPKNIEDSQNGDVYVDTKNGDVYQKANGVWVDSNDNIIGSYSTQGANPPYILNGSGTPALGNGNGGAVYSHENLTLTNVTVQDNNAANSGGGVYVTGANLTLTGNTSITDNNAENQGGGIYINAGTLNLTGSESDTEGYTYVTISSNHAELGGGVYAINANVISNLAKVYSNDASYGAGFDLDSSLLTMYNSEVYENTSDYDGGGLLLVNAAKADINASTIADNTAGRYGAGIYATVNELNIINSTISGNKAASYGGGIFFSGQDSLNLTYSTIANNIANTLGTSGVDYAGGGVYQTAGTFNMINTILAQNYQTSASDTSHDDYYASTAVNAGSITYSIIGDNNADTFFGGEGMIVMGDSTHPYSALGVSTVLENLGGPTRTLWISNSSIALNAGTTQTDTSTITVDQRGISRVHDPAAQSTIGAYEKNITTYVFTDATGDHNVYNIANWSGFKVDATAPDFFIADAVYQVAAGTAEITIAKAWDIGYHSSVKVTNGTLQINNGATMSVQDLTVENATAEDTAAITILGSLTYSTDRLSSANAALKVNNDATLTIGTADSNIANTDISLGSGQSTTVNYAYAGDQTVRNLANYGNVVISNGGSKNAAADLTISKTLTVSGSTFDAGVYDVTVTGTAATDVITIEDSTFTSTGALNAIAGNAIFDNSLVTVNALTVANGNATLTNAEIISSVVNINSDLKATGGGTSTLTAPYVYAGSYTVDADTRFNIDFDNNDFSINDTAAIADSTINVEDGSTMSFTTSGNAALDFNNMVDNTILGTLEIHAGTINPITQAKLNGSLLLDSDIVLSSATTDAIEVGKTLTFAGTVTLNSDINLSAGSVVFSDTVIGQGNSLDITTTAGDASLKDVLGVDDLTVTVNGGNIILHGDISADGNVLLNGTTTLTDDTSISGETLTAEAISGNTGTESLTLNATSTSSSIDSISNLTDLTFNGTSATYTMGGAINVSGLLTNNSTVEANTVEAGSLVNTGTFNVATMTINGDLNNSGTIDASGTVTIIGDFINTSNNTFIADEARVGGSVTDTGYVEVKNFVLTVDSDSSSSIDNPIEVCFSDGTEFDTFTIEADKNIILTSGNIIVNSFVFESDATPTSTFEIASGASVDAAAINYNLLAISDPADYYIGNYFITSSGGQLIRTMAYTDGSSTDNVIYRVGNKISAIVITLRPEDITGDGEKIAVGVVDSVKEQGYTISGIKDTVQFTINIDRNHGETNFTNDMMLGVNWDSMEQEGSGFDPNNASLFSYENSKWTIDNSVTVETPSIGRHEIVDYKLPHNGTYTIANSNADMVSPPNPMNVNIYEMANSHFLPFYDSLDTNIFLAFEIGVYPYFKPDTYATAESLDQLGEAIYRQMEYRFVTDPQTNPLHGQVSPIGAETGQAITEQASLTLTGDAPVYVIADGEYSAGEGWLPITEPASVENIEEYQEPITQGQINEFYLEFGGREDIFTRPASFKSDLDEMLDDLLAG